ncbi:MAG: DUF3160 domain-containing protein [Spirochaetales bacterium]|nr:DUF3160 domain-containing protein [Spirochaetales bacterium]
MAGKNKQITGCISIIVILFTLCNVFVAGTECGNVDENTTIDIVDAFLIARYYVDLPLEIFNPDFADVDGNSLIDIVDALLVARFYVDLIDEFPGLCQTPAPDDTPSPTAVPEPTTTPLISDNYMELTSFIPLNASEEDKLRENGFIVLDSMREETFTHVYSGIAKANTIPAFLTVDSLLHVFHLTYAHMLETVELDFFYPSLRELLTGFETEVAIEYESITNKPFLKEACRRLLVFASVAKCLINGETVSSGLPEIAPEVNGYLNAVYECSLVEPYPGEDYTNYKPRSHYVNNPLLTCYFRANTWLERKKFNVNVQYDVTSASIMASLLTANPALHALYEKIDTLMSSLKNKTSGITPFQLESAMRDSFSTIYDADGYNLLELLENRSLFQNKLFTGIYGEKLYIQFLGEHKAIDTRIFEETTTGEDRTLPKGLDVGAAVFNSQAAYEELNDDMILYPGFQSQIDFLKAEYDSLTNDDWTGSASNFWLYALRTLSEEISGNVPLFSQTGAWEREKLNTQLASWTELHSDSIYFPATPSPTPVAGAGNVWFEPEEIATAINADFITEVHLNSGSQRLAAYDFTVTYDDNYMSLNTSVGMDGVEPGVDGFVTAVNAAESGTVRITGIDAMGKGPGLDLHILTIYWRAGPTPGNSDITNNIHSLIDPDTAVIGIPSVTSVTVAILEGSLLGDVNSDGSVNIIDALLTAQYYVGLNPPQMDLSNADVNCTGTIDIVDALVIAQYFVGLIDELECDTPTPAPTGIPTPTVTPAPPLCFVEPYPRFYERLGGMCDKVINSLNEAGLPGIHTGKFQTLAAWADTFGLLARKHLDGIPLTPEENNQIHKFWIELGIYFSTSSFVQETDSKAQIVTDMYSYEESVLHEAVGNLHPIIVLYPVPKQTEVLAAVGYVLSYYEFIETENYRLSDEEWIELLNSSPPGRPDWTDIFVE